jgi:hypothetical protein
MDRLVQGESSFEQMKTRRDHCFFMLGAVLIVLDIPGIINVHNRAVDDTRKKITNR